MIRSTEIKSSPVRTLEKLRRALTLVAACASLVLYAEISTTPVTDPNAPIMVFDSTTYWFDTVYQGSIIDNEFRFTNTGKSPLVITVVTGSSGSVVPSYPKEPIAPGKSGMIRVVFHTGGRMGAQDKTVTVRSNASEPVIVLHIRGYVILPPSKNGNPVPAPRK